MKKYAIILQGLAAAVALAGSALAQTAPVRPQAGPDMVAHAAADYRARSRLPDWITPLAPGDADPVMAKRIPTRQRLANADGLALSVWCSDIRYEAGDTVTVHAQLDTEALSDDDMPERPGRRERLKGDFSMKAVVAGRIGGTIAEIVLRDDGLGRDDRRGDGIYSASFTLDPAYRPDMGYAETYSVIVSAEDRSGETVRAVGGFLYSRPAARLTGAFRDRLVDGDLVIEAEVDVAEEGRFHLMGTLASARGEALVSAQSASVLAPGRHWMALDFYGLALSERKASGPLRLESVTLTTANGMPNALGPVIEKAYRTAAYRPSDFHSRPFEDARMIDSAERLEKIETARQARQR